MMVVRDLEFPLFNLEHAITFEVVESRHASGWHGKWPGYVRPKLEFTLK